MEERFQWFGKAWDVSRLLHACESGTIKAEVIEVGRDEVMSYSKAVHGLGGSARLVALDGQRAASLTSEHLGGLGLLIQVCAEQGPMTVIVDGQAISVVLADGNHRWWRAATEARPFSCWLVSADQASAFLLDDRGRLLLARQGAVREPGALRRRSQAEHMVEGGRVVA